ncbi:hypothetical protein [Oceanicella sp. SM1341]|uniref:hypothetical protein n=1 Tax=Oceanicella sp. SM1341 TaxID=1548889 RepID=UPI000E46D80B|nr:hypothetical protein [Oceanicella sp. SM1341]
MIPELHIGAGAEALRAGFRPLDGAAEAALAAAPGEGAEQAALGLARALVCRLSRGGAEIALEDLTLAEFDALLAHLACALVSPVLTCETGCPACGTRFEFALDLPALQAALAAEAAGVSVVAGIATDPVSGRRFRLPRLRDQALLRAEGPEAWLRSLLLEGPFAPELEAEIARAAPVLTQDVQAACPECGRAGPVRFDIARYLVDSLAGEAGFLWREVHLVARAYGWALAEILALPREVRRRLAALVLADATALRRAS